MCLLPVVHCSLLPGLGGLVTQPLDSLGYVPLETALATCEAGARRDLELEIARYSAAPPLQVIVARQAINHLEQSFHVLDSQVVLVIPRVSLIPDCVLVPGCSGAGSCRRPRRRWGLISRPGAGATWSTRVRTPGPRAANGGSRSRRFV